MNGFVRRILKAGCGALLSAAAHAAVVEPAPEWRYTLRPHDTLIGVSARYLAEPARWPQLQRHNRIADPYHMTPGSALRIPLAWMRHAPAPVAVTAVAGKVQVSVPGAVERPLAAGERLAAGAALTTGANSSASLRFADGSQLVLQPQSRLVLDTLSVYEGGGMVDTRLRLQQGRAEIAANPRRTAGSRLRVTTPSAVAAVRGTRFRVEAEAAVSREETLEGAVDLTAAGAQVAVMGGRGSLAETGKPPLPPVALLPAPDMTALPARVDSLPLRFSLPALKGAASWLGQIAPDAHFETILLEKTSHTPVLGFADLPDGHYVLRARAADAQGLQGQDGQHVFEVDARPFAPLPVAPGTRVREPQPALQWTRVAGAEAYQIQLAHDAGFTRLLDNVRVAGSSYTLPQRLQPGTVYWRAASVESGEQGPFFAARALTFDPLPGAPEINQSAPRYEAGVLHVALPSPQDGLTYEAALSHDAARARTLWQGKSADGVLSIPDVEPGDYYLSVRLVEADGAAGPWAARGVEAPMRFRWEGLLLLPLLAL